MKNKLWLKVIVAVLVVAGLIAVFKYRTFSVPIQTSARGILNTVDLDAQRVMVGKGNKVVYSRAVDVGLGVSGHSQSQMQLVVANIDGSNQEVLLDGLNNYGSSFLFIPEREEVLIFDYPKVQIMSMSLKVAGSPKIIFSGIDKGFKSLSRGVLSLDHSKLVFTVGRNNVVDPKDQVVVLDLLDPLFTSKTIIPPNLGLGSFSSIFPLYTDQQGRIFFGWSAPKDCAYGLSPLVMTWSGEMLSKPFNLDLKTLESVSLDGQWAVNLMEHPQGISELTMCGGKNKGVLTLTSLVDGESNTFANDRLREFRIDRWILDSRYLAYQVRTLNWSGRSNEGYNGSQFEKMSVYDTRTSHTTDFNSIADYLAWLIETTGRGTQYAVSSAYTDNKKPDTSKLYVNGQIIDDVKKFSWSSGPAVFEVLGFFD